MNRQVPIESQRVDAPLTSHATVLVLTLNETDEAFKVVRAALAGVSGITNSVAIRDLNASSACTVGVGSDVWDRPMASVKPSELHPFRVIEGKTHTAVSTPGDLLFHIRSEQCDLNFKFERQLMDQLGDAVKVVDETVGFRYFLASETCLASLMAPRTQTVRLLTTP